MKGLKKAFLLWSTIFISSLACFQVVSASSAMRHSCNSPCLLVANVDRVLALDYDNKSIFPVVSNLSFAIDVDFHYNKGYIFWCNLLSIQRSNMDGTNITVIHNETSCYGLAVEWDSLQLYWTGYYNNTIMVSDLDGNNKRIVFSSLSGPTDIVLDPHQRLMFWIDRGNISKVERSTLYGTQHVTIAVHNVSYSTGITLDRRRKLIFWLSQWNLIESIDYSGNNRRKVFQSDGLNFFGLTFISSDLFATEWSLPGSVYRLNPSNGKVKSNVTIEDYWRDVYGLVAYDSALQLPVVTCPVPSPSSGTRATCPRNATVHHNAVYYNTTCQFSCEDGYVGSGSQVRRCQRNGTWSGQNYSCQKITCPVLSPPTHGTRYGCPGNLPLYNGTVCRFTCNNGYVGSGSQVRRCQYDGIWSGQNFVCKTLKCPTLSLPRNGVLLGCNTNNTEMLYDTECRFFCKEGSEAIGATIKRCAENGTWIGPDLVCPELRRRTCNHPCLLVPSYDHILALDFGNKTSYSVISNLTKAAALDFHYNLGYIFWSDIGDRNIKRSNMDGTNIRIIHNDTGYCWGLAVEWNSLKLYWTDSTNGTISVSDFQGNHKRILWSSKAERPDGIVLDLHKGLMFWTDWGNPPKIEKSTLHGTNRVTIVTTNLTHPFGITLDRRNKLIFWVDNGMDVIESVDYNGNSRKLLFHWPGISFSGVTFTSSYLFINGWNQNWVSQLDAYNGTVVGNVTTGGILTGGIVAFNGSLQLPVTMCPALPAPTDGAILGCPGNASVDYDTVCQFLCNNGYIGYGSQERRCQHDGTWSGREFICQTVKCTLPTNGVLLGCNTNSTEMSLGAECRFSCKERAEEIGSTVRKCSENGTWSGVDLVCAGIRFTNTFFWRVLLPCTIDDLGRRISLRSSIVFPRLAVIVDRDS